jgi:hypothetical protein
VTIELAPAWKRATTSPTLRLWIQAVGVIFLVARWWHFVTVPSSDPDIAVDTFTYWSVPFEDPYQGVVAERGSYLYSPAFLQAIAPLRALSFEAVWPIWVALNLLAAAYCVGPLAAAVLSAFPPLDNDIHIGNIHAMMAAALALAARYPAAWSFLALTKATVVLPTIWYLFRREWRNFAVAVGVTLALTAISFVLAPDTWLKWIAELGSANDRGGTPGTAFLIGRLVAATLLLAYGAWRNLPIVVPVAVLLSVPIPWGTSTILLLALPHWWQLRRRAG